MHMGSTCAWRAQRDRSELHQGYQKTQIDSSNSENVRM